jgi:hypothetical protein
MIILKSYLITLEASVIFETAEAVSKIASGLKLNFHKKLNQVKLDTNGLINRLLKVQF